MTDRWTAPEHIFCKFCIKPMKLVTRWGRTSIYRCTCGAELRRTATPERT